jgi:hypothetical protein
VIGTDGTLSCWRGMGAIVSADMRSAVSIGVVED